MPNLTVQAPQLIYEDAPGLAVMEMPIEIYSEPVLLPDGNEFDLQNISSGKAGFFIYRKDTPAAAAEIWNDEQKEWQPDPGAALNGLNPMAFAFDKGKTPRWKGILVAAGSKDKNGDDQFQVQRPTFPPGGPEYFVRAYFETQVDNVQYTGLSPATDSIQFLSTTHSSRAGLSVGDDETPKDATEVQFFLRNNNRQVIGIVKVRNIAQSGSIEIVNYNNSGSEQARIEMQVNGNIEIIANGVININASGLNFNGEQVQTLP